MLSGEFFLLAFILFGIMMSGKLWQRANKRQRRQAPKNTSNFKEGQMVGCLAIRQTRKFNSLRNNSKLDGPKKLAGAGVWQGCPLIPSRVVGGWDTVQQNFQHLPEHVLNANMRRRGQKRRGRSEKGGHFVGGCCMLYPPNGHKVEHPDT